MAYIDFQELKDAVSIEEVGDFLDLQLKQTGAQLRGGCPVCGGDRTLVITPSKGAFYCFASKKGGDLIALAAHVRELKVKDAAQELAERYLNRNGNSTRNSTVRTEPEEREEGDGRGSQPLQPLTYLQATHEAVQALGVSPETCEHFEAGYAPRGILRGRLAIPIHDLTGTLVAYCGRAVKDEQPLLTFPKGFEPELYVFNLHRIEEAELYISTDPLDVLLAYENGVENMISFLHKATNVVPLRKPA